MGDSILTSIDGAHRRRNTLPALGVAIVVGLVWIGLGLPHAGRELAAMSDRPAEAAGYLTGSAIVPALVVWLVLFFAHVRQRQPERGGIYFVILVVTLVAANFAGGHLAKFGATRADVETTLRGIADVQQAVADGAAPETIQRQPQSRGQMRDVEVLLRDTLAEAAADQQVYQRELAALGFPDLISPERVAADPGQRRTMAKLEELQATIAIHTKREARRVETLRARAAALPKNAFNQGFLEGFDKARQRGEAGGSNRSWALEAAMVDEYRKSIEALQRASGRWRVRNGSYVFDRQADLDAWQAPLQRADQLAAEQAKIAADVTARLRRGPQAVGSAP